MYRLLSWEQHHHYFSWLLTFLVHVLNYRSTLICERSCWVIRFSFSKLNSIIKVCFQQNLSKQGHGVLNYYSLCVIWNHTYILPTWKSMFLRFLMSLLKLSTFFHTYYIEWWINLSLDPELKIKAKSFQKFLPPVNEYLNVAAEQSIAQFNPYHISSSCCQ